VPPAVTPSNKSEPLEQHSDGVTEVVVAQELPSSMDENITKGSTVIEKHEAVNAQPKQTEQHFNGVNEVIVAQELPARIDASVPPSGIPVLKSVDIDIDVQSNITSGRSLANAMVMGSFEQAAIDIRPKSVASVSNFSARGAPSELSLDMRPPIRVPDSPCASSLASACMFGMVSLEDLRPEAYECSVASMSAVHEREESAVHEREESVVHEREEDFVIAFPRPMSQASRVSGTTVGDLPMLSEKEEQKQQEAERDLTVDDLLVLSEQEEQKQKEAERDSFQPDSLQLLREDTIQELQRERDEALLMGTHASGDEREVLEIKVEMLDIALQDARAEYASIYRAQDS
jgi:hypothetical protein